MNLKQWLQCTSGDEQRIAARAAGTKVVYLAQIAEGKRQPSPDLCLRLLKTEPRFTLRELRADLADLCEVANGR